jgi:hypothetical protein
MRIRYALAMGFTLALLGCGVSSTSNTAPSDATSSTSTGAGSELSPEQLAGTTLVVLKVPNMT